MNKSQQADQANFLLLAETAQCLVMILRQDGAFAYVNSFAECAIGYSASELLGRNCLDILTTEDGGEPVETLIASGFRGGKESLDNTEPKWLVALRCRNGCHCELTWNTTLLDDFEGGPGLLMVAPNPADREADAEDLQSQAACLRAVLDTAVDGIITIDEAGIVQSANAAVVDIFGFPTDELIGQNVSVLMPAPYRNEHDRYMKNYLKSGEKKIIGIGREVRGLRKDGTTFPCYLSVSEVPLPGRCLFTGIARDITRPKRAEERALQAERLAAIGQTVAGLAHESRNAFQRSQACLEMLSLELEGRPDELQLVGRTQRALDHLHKLYEEVRDYAAPIILDRHVCDLSHLWRDAWSHLDIARGDREFDLEESIEVADTSCEVDWFAIGQVFRNIFENAITACDDPGIVKVACRSCTFNGESALQISIRDNGPGIADDIRDEVFQAFFTTRTKGTGLGMAIARRILEAHGGAIRVGDHGSGAEFILVLPRS